eukprot:1557181-Prymnesium_polylepis.1
MPFFDCVVARDSGYNTIAFMSNAVDGRSAARCRNAIVWQNVTFPQIPATLACGTSVGLGPRHLARGGCVARRPTSRLRACA